MNELDGKLGMSQFRPEQFNFDVTYRPGIVNKAVSALSSLDFRANARNPVDDEVPAMTTSTTPGTSQSDVFDGDEDLLLTWEDIADIDEWGFPPEMSSSKFLAAQWKDELDWSLMSISD